MVKVTELKKRCKELGLKRYSKLNKPQLEQLLKKHEKGKMIKNEIDEKQPKDVDLKKKKLPKCPNGYHRSKKTGQCEIKKNLKAKQITKVHAKQNSKPKVLEQKTPQVENITKKKSEKIQDVMKASLTNKIKNKQYFNDEYKIKKGKGFLIIEAKNAYVVLSVKNETFKDSYKNVPKHFCSNVRICGLYRQHDKNKPPAPQNFTRKMLCYALFYLYERGSINKNSIISLEADSSPHNNLVNKVYIPMGFKITGVWSVSQQQQEQQEQQQQQQQQQQWSSFLMSTTVDTILSWCKEKY
jgi:hypothetical protein